MSALIETHPMPCGLARQPVKLARSFGGLELDRPPPDALT